MARRKKDRSPAEKKRDFIKHLRVYLAMSIFFVVLNVMTSSGNFWAIWPIMGWGIGVVMEGLSVYGPLRDREDEYESDDFFDINNNRPNFEDRVPRPEARPQAYRDEDLV